MNRIIKIYAERNTCSRYLRALLEANLEVLVLEGGGSPFIQRLQEVLPGQELVRDVAAYFSYPHDLGWKHSRPKDAQSLGKASLVRKRGVLFITITKNPYSWLLSLHRRPYHQRYQRKPPFIEFLQTPWKTLIRENVSQAVNSPVELWNIKNRSYISLHDSELDTVALTAEALLKDPETEITRIAREFSIPRTRPHFTNYDSSTKTSESNTVTRDSEKDTSYYRDYYLGEKWKEMLSVEALDLINRSLDPALMKYYGYDYL